MQLLKVTNKQGSAMEKLIKIPYAEKLRDPRWQRKRLEILSRDDFTCQKCNSEENELHVHHRYYNFKTEPWDYPNEALVTICKYCHEEEGVYKDSGAYLVKILQQEKGFLDSEISELAQIILNLDPKQKNEFLFTICQIVNTNNELINLYNKYSEWPELEP